MISDYDATDYLDSEEVILEYIKAAKENGCPALLARAMSNASRARGILGLAKETGIERGEICKIFAAAASPSPAAIEKITKALTAPIHA